MGNTGSVDGGKGFKHQYATIAMPDEGCLCTNGIPSRGSFKYDDRAKLIPELTTAMLSEKSAMGVYDSFIRQSTRRRLRARCRARRCLAYGTRRSCSR
jgi:hypothetical protein